MSFSEFLNPRINQCIYPQAKNLFIRFLKDVNLYEQFKVNLYNYQTKKVIKHGFKFKPNISTFLYETSIYYWLSRAFPWDETSQGKDAWATLHLLWGAKIIEVFHNELDERQIRELATHVTTSSTSPSYKIITDLISSKEIPIEFRNALHKANNNNPEMYI